MKKDKDFIKIKLDALNVDEITESESVPDTLRDKYPALSARFTDSRKAKTETRAQKRSLKGALIPAIIGGAASAAVAVAIIVAPTVQNDGSKDGSSSSGAHGNSPYRHEITLDALTENYDVLLPESRDGIVCFEYIYPSTGSAAYVKYTLDAFTVDIIIDGDYKYENGKTDGLTADGATELFTYKYKIEHSYCSAAFDYNDYKYYVVLEQTPTDEQRFSDLLGSLKPESAE